MPVATVAFDAKVDWNASTNDKVYVRYSKQTHEATPEATAFPLSFASLSENPFWSVGVNWNRIIGTTLVNDLLIGFNDNSFNGTPIDLNGVGSLTPAGNAGRSRPALEVRRATYVSNMDSASRHQHRQPVFQINERLTC